MSWLHRLSNVFRSKRVQRDIERELAFHLAERADELRARGLNAGEGTASDRAGPRLRMRRSAARDGSSATSRSTPNARARRTSPGGWTNWGATSAT